MAENTVKFNELTEKSELLSTDLLGVSDSDGVLYKSTLNKISNFLSTVNDSQFRGSLAIADTPTLDGWYFASETGTYTNAGSLVIDVSDNIVIIIVSDTQTTFSKVDIPITLTIDSTPTESSTNAVQSGGVATEFNRIDVRGWTPSGQFSRLGSGSIEFDSVNEKLVFREVSTGGYAFHLFWTNTKYSSQKRVLLNINNHADFPANKKVEIDLSGGTLNKGVLVFRVPDAKDSDDLEIDIDEGQFVILNSFTSNQGNDLIFGYVQNGQFMSPFLTQQDYTTQSDVNTIVSNAVNSNAYPLQPLATDNELKAFVKDAVIYNGNPKSKYHLSYVVRANVEFDLWRVYLNDENGVVAEFNEINYTEQSGIDKIDLVEKNGSGITANLYVDWSAIPLEYFENGITYDEAGLSSDVIRTIPQREIVQSIEDLDTKVNSLVSKTTGKAENFLKGVLAKKQVYKIAYFGDSIFYSGFDAGILDGTKGFATLENDHFASRTLDYLNFNKPTFRGVIHSDWTLNGSPTFKNAWYPYNSRTGGSYVVLDGTKYAQIDGITGNKTCVLVFEGGAIGNAYETGVAEILVSTDGGTTFVTPTSLGLQGKLTNKGFGDTEVFETAKNEFDTAFTYPVDVPTHKTDIAGTSPIREVFYQLDENETYSFRIKQKSGDADSVNFWGVYYFSGETIVPVNLAYPGANWFNLRQVTYNSLVLADVDYVITEAVMYHDWKSEANILIDIENFISEIHKYGMELSLTSCPPGGVITEPFVQTLGSEEPSYPVGENFVYTFNHRKAVNLDAQPLYSDYPEKDATYEVVIDGVTYTGKNALTKPNEVDYATWYYRDKLMLVFDVVPSTETANYPLTFTKTLGNGASSLIGASVFYTIPPMERHRELIKQTCDKFNLKFIDVLASYERIAESVGETLETDGYAMDENHPWFAELDLKSRKFRLDTTDGITMPDVGDVFSATIDAVLRHFEVTIANSTSDYIELKSIDGAGEDYIYVGDSDNVPNTDSLWDGITYNKVSGSGSVNSFNPIGLNNIILTKQPLPMNYMSNYFSRTDGHHLNNNSVDVVYLLIEDLILKDCRYKI